MPNGDVSYGLWRSQRSVPRNGGAGDGELYSWNGEELHEGQLLDFSTVRVYLGRDGGQ